MAAPDPDLASLIARSRDPSIPVGERHGAFAEIVRRFHDLAVASAYTRLRDHALAEDAAQDAFIVAWGRLAQLRDPLAFPGWIRRLVLTQCHRRLRCARLPCVPLEEAQAVAAGDDPIAAISARHDSALLQRALSRLAPGDRLVLSLFYGCERSQKEIAGWLGVPVTTVARRLAHARRRLQRRALDMLSGELRAGPGARRETFLMALAARLRRAEVDDAAGIVNLASQVAAERAHAMPPSAPAFAYVVEDPVSRGPAAYAAATQTIFKPIYELQLAMGNAAIRSHAADALLMQIVEDVSASGAISLQYWSSARQRSVLDFLLSRGFEVMWRGQDWRLEAGSDVGRTAVGERRPDYAFRDLRALAADPALFDQALELVTRSVEDSAAGRMMLPIHPDTLRRALRAQRDGAIALDNGSVVGLIGASVDDVVPNAFRLNILAVRHDRWRRGCATALIDWLLHRWPVGTVRIVVPDGSDLAVWLTRCGFVHATDALVLERLLRKAVRVAAERLDEFVGQYVVADLPLPPITIERHGDSLVSKARDMRDVLLASSENEFFTRHHYGTGRFERDGQGNVIRLVFTEGQHEFVAVRLDARVGA